MDDSSVTRANAYTVRLDNFEGPLDLLVYLIQRNEMDIMTVSVSKIAEDYFRLMAQVPSVDLDQGGEFLVLASNLILFKARQLLPSPPLEEDEELFDPFAETRRLEEHERFRKIAQILKQYEMQWSSVHSRKDGTAADHSEVIWDLEEVSIFDLYQAFQKVLRELGAERPSVIFGADYTVDEKVAELRMLAAELKTFSLTEYLKQMQSRSEIIVTFLALLELVRLQELAVKQHKAHGEIWVVGLQVPQEREPDDEVEQEDGHE